MYVALSGGTLLISVMSQQYNCLMELYTNFYKILLLMKMYLPSSFILRYVRAEMNVHAFMNALDQKDYWYPRKKLKLWKYMYKVNGELSSCDITYSGRVPSREGDIHNLCIITSLKWSYPNLLTTFTVGFVKLLSTHPIHIVVWGNFPFKNNFISVWILLIQMIFRSYRLW